MSLSLNGLMMENKTPYQLENNSFIYYFDKNVIPPNRTQRQ